MVFLFLSPLHQKSGRFARSLFCDLHLGAPFHRLGQRHLVGVFEIAADGQAVRDALALVGASALAERDFNCISDGQRQRILLARAICQQPEVILLDEPTSFLDIKGKIELLSILQTLAHTQHLAVLVSLHELDMAQKIADAVVCVSPQGVSGVLTPQEAFAPENIQTLYRLSREQYETLFAMDGVELKFQPEALERVAEVALERKTGARGLRGVLENVMTDIMFRVPSDKSIKRVIITADCVKDGKPPVALRNDNSDSV